MKKTVIVGPCSADSKSLMKNLGNRYNLDFEEFRKFDEATEFLCKTENKPDLILASRIISGDEAQGLDLLEVIKEKCSDVPVVLLTRFKDVQNRAIEKGAVAAFDMDLVIGYVTPAKKNKQKEVFEILDRILK